MMPKNWRHNQLSSFLGLFAVCFIVQVATSLMAQTATGVLRGTVSDESGKAVANASVTATSIDTRQKQTANTGLNGTYQLDLPAGNYRLMFEAAGFKTLEISATVSGTVRWKEFTMPSSSILAFQTWMDWT
jgi:hypothetical protein